MAASVGEEGFVGIVHHAQCGDGEDRGHRLARRPPPQPPLLDGAALRFQHGARSLAQQAVPLRRVCRRPRLGLRTAGLCAPLVSLLGVARIRHGLIQLLLPLPRRPRPLARKDAAHRRGGQE